MIGDWELYIMGCKRTLRNGSIYYGMEIFIKLWDEEL